MPESGIVCENLGKKYGDFTALRGVDLAIRAGDFLTIFGPNGAGKTTLLKLLCGITHPSGGTARVNGSDAHDPAVRRKIGVISHKSYLYDNLTALENLLFYAEMYGMENKERRALALLESVELDRRKNDLVRNFSRGMVQRLSIARALVADPEYIFLDEPFTGLDHHSAVMFQRLLSELHGRKKTVMMITHDIALGIAAATRAIILKGGRKVHDAPAEGMDPSAFLNVYLEKVGA